MSEPENTPITLEFLARQQRQLIDDVAGLRDDMQVLTAIVLRQDGTMAALIGETRATHSQISRMNDRLRKVEAR